MEEKEFQNQLLNINKNLTLYSGDIITFSTNIDDKESFLVEIVEVKSKPYLKLQLMEENKSLIASVIPSWPLKFSNPDDEKKILLFSSAGSDHKIVLLRKKSKPSDKDQYLFYEKGKFYLEDEASRLTIKKEEITSELEKRIYDVEYSNEINLSFDNECLEKAIRRDIFSRGDYISNKVRSGDVNKESIREETDTETYSFSITDSNSLEITFNIKGKVPFIELGGGVKWIEANNRNISELQSRALKHTSTVKFSCPPHESIFVLTNDIHEEINLLCEGIIIRNVRGNEYSYHIKCNWKSIYRCSKTESNSLEFRNILIVGWTSEGKTTLANLLLRKDTDIVRPTEAPWKDDFFEPFPVNKKSIQYWLVDNVGFGNSNTKIGKENTLLSIGDAIKSMHKGLSHVLFVFNKFTPLHIESYRHLSKLLSGDGITRRITLVRTNFPSFRIENECEVDRNILLEIVGRNDELKEIVTKKKVVYVNNPSIISDNNEQEIASDDRKESRVNIMQHLDGYCNTPYESEKWENLGTLVEECLQEPREVITMDDKNQFPIWLDIFNVFKYLRV